jgi:trk system potassium uptake protein TrkA
MHMNFLKKRKAIVAGAGRTGFSVAKMLENAGCLVSLIEIEQRVCDNLDPDFEGQKLVGDAADLDTYKKCDIKDADLIIVSTGNENRNCLVSQAVRYLYPEAEVFAIIDDPGLMEILAHKKCHVFSPSVLAAEAIFRCGIADIQGG